MKHNLDFLKTVIVFCIVCLVFFDISVNFKFLNNKLFKIVFLFAILAALYYDLHSGILLTILFLMLLIQFNTTTLDAIDAIKNKRMELFLASMPSEYERHEKDETITQNHKVVECDNEKKNEISNDIFDYSVDTKVKPYEVFVKMLTTKDHLDNASNSAFLQPDPEDLL
jgi:hypothetical protein